MNNVVMWGHNVGLGHNVGNVGSECECGMLGQACDIWESSLRYNHGT